MCAVLGVNESGYYRWLKSLDVPKRDELLLVKIKEVLDIYADNDNYGAERMQLALKQNGIEAGIRKIKRIMRENGWMHEKKRRPNGITKADIEAQKAENLIQRDFSAERPYEKLLTDITEVQCADGKLYVSPIMDCFSGEIIALCMDNNMRKELVISTINSALRGRNLHGAILHSDRGSQYTSAAFKDRLKEFGIKQSMSGTGKCYDNARMESFFATLKKEMLYRIPAHRLPMERVKSIIFRYIMVYYNRMRVYTRNPRGLPPAVYRETMQNQIAA